MSDKRFELTRRRLIGGVSVIGVASVATGAGTYASFSDTESSIGNTVQAGTMNLQGASNGRIYINSEPGETNDPGAEGGNSKQTVTTTYTGTIEPVEVDIKASLEEPDGNAETVGETDNGDAEPTEPADPDLKNDLGAREFGRRVRVDKAVVKLKDKGGTLRSEDDLLRSDTSGSAFPTDTDVDDTGDGSGEGGNPGPDFVDLVEFADALNGGQGNGFVKDVRTDDYIELTMDITFDKDAGNAAQADGVELLIKFTAQQPRSD